MLAAAGGTTSFKDHDDDAEDGVAGWLSRQQSYTMGLTPETQRE